MNTKNMNGTINMMEVLEQLTNYRSADNFDPHETPIVRIELKELDHLMRRTYDVGKSNGKSVGYFNCMVCSIVMLIVFLIGKLF